MEKIKKGIEKESKERDEKLTIFEKELTALQGKVINKFSINFKVNHYEKEKKQQAEENLSQHKINETKYNKLSDENTFLKCQIAEKDFQVPFKNFFKKCEFEKINDLEMKTKSFEKEKEEILKWKNKFEKENKNSEKIEEKIQEYEKLLKSLEKKLENANSEIKSLKEEQNNKNNCIFFLFSFKKFVSSKIKWRT